MWARDGLVVVTVVMVTVLVVVVGAFVLVVEAAPGLHQTHQDAPKVPDVRLHRHRLPVYRHARARRLATLTAVDTQQQQQQQQFRNNSGGKTPEGSGGGGGGGGSSSIKGGGGGRGDWERKRVVRSKDHVPAASSVVGSPNTHTPLLPQKKMSKNKRTHPIETCAAKPPSYEKPGRANDRVIDVAVITPCNASHQYSKVKVMPVVMLAVRHVEETGLHGPLQNYTIKVRHRDSQTSSTHGPLAAVDLYFNNSAGMLVLMLMWWISLHSSLSTKYITPIFHCQPIASYPT
ncbi:hypothetical protein Pcinc_021350 [Petrolisthes cinctipes]|uniref:Uncharacterized protein n=1 Tax=Petrolisthes cinctipes TaxID=88211 RepID=A0AAE1FKB8_PETCI|nr:hypothetical protein Pcinc_021350 [Petrolisthes cinctipes]